MFSLLEQARTEELSEGVDYHLRGIVVRGGAPTGGANPDLDLLGWTMPAWLDALYGVHFGLGPWRGARDRWGPGAILPWDEVQPLTARVRFGEENVLFDPADCVLLARDTSGGGLVLVGRTTGDLHWFDGCTHRLSEGLDGSLGLARAVSFWIPDGP